jgi:exosortase
MVGASPDVWHPGGATPSGPTAVPSQSSSVRDPEAERSTWFFFGALVVLWTCLSFRLAGIWETNSQYSHGWLVPFLAAWMFWRRWQTRPTPTCSSALACFVILVPAFLAFAGAWFMAESSPDWRPALWVLALAALVSSLALVQAAGGRAWLKHLAFPFFFALVAVPWPFNFETRLTVDLSMFAAEVTTQVLQALGIVADRQGNVIILANELLGVEEACSGIRSLQSSIMAGLFMGELYALSLKWRSALCLVGILVAYLLNILRMLLLSLFANAGGAASVAQWHDPAGFAILLVTLGVLWVMCRLLLSFPSAWRPEPPPSILGKSGGTARGIPALAAGIIVALLLLAGMVEAWYRHRESAMLESPGWTVSHAADGASAQDEPLADEIRGKLGYDTGFQRTWTGDGGSRFHMIYLRWEPSRKSAATTTPHLPELCQAAIGRKVVSKSEEFVTDIHGIPIRYHLYEIEAGARKIHLLYVPNDDRAGSQLLTRYEIQAETTADSRWKRIRFALEGRRNTGQRSLQLALIGGEDADTATTILTSMLPSIIQREDPQPR